MKEKANQEMEKASQTMFSHKRHRILPFKPNNNRLMILLQPQVQGMVLLLLLKLTQHVLMCCLPIMKSKSTTDALVEEVNINEMQWRRETETPRKGFLFLWKKLMHFDMDYINDHCQLDFV